MAKKKRLHEEANLQVGLINHLRLILPQDAIAFAVPNGGSRNVIEAMNLKRQGALAGIPDIILVWRGQAFGLELKSAAGKLSPSQIDTFSRLRICGMKTWVARTHDEAIAAVSGMGIPLKIPGRKNLRIAA